MALALGHGYFVALNMLEESQNASWEAVQAVETINQELTRAAAPLQAGRHISHP